MPISEDQITATTENLNAEADTFARRLTRQIVGLRQAGSNQSAISQIIGDDLLEKRGPLGQLLAVVRDESKRTQQQFYNDSIEEASLRGENPDQAKFFWNAIGVNTCKSCRARHGQIKTWAQWNTIGRPGFGTTVCTFNCRCILIPVRKAIALHGVRSEGELTKVAREPIQERAKEIKRQMKARKKKLAPSTVDQKLGQFKNERRDTQ